MTVEKVDTHADSKVPGVEFEGEEGRRNLRIILKDEDHCMTCTSASSSSTTADLSSTTQSSKVERSHRAKIKTRNPYAAAEEVFFPTPEELEQLGPKVTESNG